MGRRWVGRCIRVAWEGPAAESRRGPKKRLQLLLLACCCRCPLPRPFLTRGTCPLLLLLLLDIRPLDRTIQMPVNATFPLSFFACIRPLLILSCARTLSNIGVSTQTVVQWSIWKVCKVNAGIRILGEKKKKIHTEIDLIFFFKDGKWKGRILIIMDLLDSFNENSLNVKINFLKEE